MNSAAAKRAMRRRIREARGPRGMEPAAEAAAHACDHLFGQKVFIEAGRIGLYAALPDELPTRALFDRLRGASRECLFPRMGPQTRLEFVRVTCWEDLEPGELGVLEPAADAPAVVVEESDVVIVPGLAFDRNGWRLGRGKGYYDRTFPPGESSQPWLFGIVWADRVLESVPHDSHDRAMDAIVTEQRFLWTRGHP